MMNETRKGVVDEIHVESRHCMGTFAVLLRYRLVNSVLKTVNMPSEWRRSILVPAVKGKGDIYKNVKKYRGLKLLSHTFQLWERVMNKRLRESTIRSLHMDSCLDAETRRIPYVDCNKQLKV